MSTTKTAVPKPAAKPLPVITLDRSKAFGTVAGDRLPDDPFYSVAFFQDDLPFDVNGKLIPDDGKRVSTPGKNSEGKDVVHPPLYTDARAAKLERKIQRMSRGVKPVEMDEVTEEDTEEDKGLAAQEVNLEAWLRGEVNYEAFLISAAVKARYHINKPNTKDIVECLVFDEKLIPENEVAPHLLRMAAKVA